MVWIPWYKNNHMKEKKSCYITLVSLLTELSVMYWLYQAAACAVCRTVCGVCENAEKQGSFT